MHEQLRNEAEQEVLEESHGELEVGPIVTVLKSLQSITLEVDLTIEVLLVEDLHGDLALAAVGSPVMFAVELQVVLDGKATVLGLLGLAGRDSGRNRPESHENRHRGEDSEEDRGVEASTDLAGKVPRHHEEEEDHQAIGEAVTAWRVGRDGCILDSRILDITHHNQYRIGPDNQASPKLGKLLTRVVGTPQSKSGLDCSGAAGVWMNSKSSVDSGWRVVMAARFQLRGMVQ